MTATEARTERDRWFLGTLVQILADGSDTGGQLAVFEQQARRGFSPPRHVHHREDTALLVLEGAITVVVGDERVEVEAGGFVWLPRDVPHTFRVGSDTVRQPELVTPAGFEQFHIDAGQQSEPSTRRTTTSTSAVTVRCDPRQAAPRCVVTTPWPSRPANPRNVNAFRAGCSRPGPRPAGRSTGHEEAAQHPRPRLTPRVGTAVPSSVITP